ncbi:MAG: carbon-nitrogen hydrolase family protein [Gammaproteobacteria bacterium]|nr:carbon-nitrogen hydrolase family protein [Gammaproteobacteria bacterium]
MSRIALVQMSGRADWPANREFLRAALAEAKAGGAELVLLPENAAVMGRSDRDKLALAEAAGSGPIQDFLAGEAARLGLWLVAGTIPEQSPEPDRVYNACPVYDAAGREVARYRKIHLFDVSLRAGAEVYRESATVVPGTEPVCVDTPVGRIGLSVCYDLRFPELYRALVAQGAEVFSIPSAFTQPTGQAHWHSLLRARAIENLCYVLAPAQTGEHDGGRLTYGHSLAVGPWGEILAEKPESTGVLFAEIDSEEIRRRREAIPCLEHRRL